MSEGELDILITRVIDGRVTTDEWRRIEFLAAQDPGVWRELAQAQRDDAALRQAVSRAAGVAVGVELPAHAERVREAAEITSHRSRNVAMWGGWFAAAAVALAFVAQPGFNSGAQTAGITVPSLSASDTLKSYMEKGRQEGLVIDELPEKVLVTTNPAADGRGYDVVYLRLIMERAQVPDLYRFSSNEFGQSVPVRVEVTPQPVRTGRPY